MTTFPYPSSPPLVRLSLLAGQYQLLFSDIVLLEGQANYTLFYCHSRQPILTSKSLSFYQDRLPTYLMRVHKSYFVNLHFVTDFNGETLSLSDGRRIPVSRRRRREVREYLQAQKFQ